MRAASRRFSVATLLLCGLLAACTNPTPSPNDTSSGSGSSSAEASVPSYSVDENFKNVYNIDFVQNKIPDGKARELLLKNNFVVLRSYNNEFFSTYEKNRYALDPNFVTSDSLLHTYHLLFDHVLAKTEEEKLLPLANNITTDMLNESLKQYTTLKGSPWENAARRNVGFFAVAKKLLDPAFELPAIAKEQAEAELKLIASHDTLTQSPLWEMGGTEETTVDTPWGPLSPGKLKEDYTQYIPRGHYDKSEALQRYFRAMMWYGRLTFRFKNPDEVRSALLITWAVDQQTIKDQWQKLYDITAFFVGTSDDLTFEQLKTVADKVYKGMSLTQIARDEAKLQQFMKDSGTLPSPQINSMPIMRADMGNPDREQEIKGFRFMGQRFTLDSAIFQRLICRDVGTKDGNKDCGGGIPGSRMLPKSLDIAAAFGSEEALSLLRHMGETEYLYYEENMQKLREHVASLDTDTWTQNLYWGWLYALDPLLDVPGDGYPAFMKSAAWVRKQLQTFFGSWTELRHDTILYVKQSYAELGGGGGDLPEKDDRGYVEPVPQVFDRLALLTAMTRDGLAARNLLPDSQRNNLNRMEELSNKLQRIAEKELANEKLTDEDYELIRSYGGQIEHLWHEVNKEAMEKAGMTQADFLHENPAAIVADVATDPNGVVLEEATGYVDEIFVLVPVEGRLKLLQGTVYSYYEFPWPMTDRLTDARWRELLRNNDPGLPRRPEWTSTFLAE